jgi:hypothetical protein
MLRKILLATLLLAFFVIAPALAEPDTTYYAQPVVLKDDNRLQIELNSIVASDLPRGSLIYAFPPDQYRYYTVYFTKYNPTDHEIRYQFNITFVDSNGTVYTSEDNILATGIGAGIRVSDEPKEFPVARNATGLYLKWYHLNTYLNEYEWTNIAVSPHQAATPTPVPATTATPTPTPAASPTATAKPAPADGFLPLLAIGLVASGFVLARARK